LGETLNFYEGQTCSIRATVEIIRQIREPVPTRGGVDAAGGHAPAPTLTGMIGAARAVTLHRYGLLLDEPIRRRREAAVRPD
jgi:hypothetical protein